MKLFIAMLIALCLALGAWVEELESRPPKIVRTPAAEELPWVIFINRCEEPFVAIWTSEPPTWFTPDDTLDAEQSAKLQTMINAGQWHLIDTCLPLTAL